jgi:hypothetical protein
MFGALEVTAMYKQIFTLTQSGIISAAILASAALADTTIQVTRTISDLDNNPKSTVIAPNDLTRPQTIIETTRTTTSSTRPLMISEKPVIRLDYQHRLDLMKEQMDNAISRGWLSPLDTAVLQSRYNELVSGLTLARAHSFPSDEEQALERQFNSFNIDLSDRMAARHIQ